MRPSCPCALALLATLWVASARAEQPTRPADDAPPVPPTTAATIASPPVAPAPTPPPATPAPAPAPFSGFVPAPAPVLPPEPADAAPDAASVAVPLAASPPPSPGNVAPPAAHVTADRRRLNVAAAVGVGVTFDHTLGGVNPLGFGFGVRGDYRLLDELALGARVLYFVGGSSVLPSGKIEMTSWLVAAEAAYVIDLEPILLEPGLALGVASRNVDGPPAFASTTGQGFVPGSEDRALVGFYLAPGVDLVVPLGMISRDLELFFLGGDVRLDLVFGHGVSANLQLLAQGGLSF